MENEVEGNLSMEGVRELGDSGEPNQWTINAGDGKENHLATCSILTLHQVYVQ